MQNVTVNPVELATYLAASRLDELYQEGSIEYPYEGSLYDLETTEYTEEGQKHFYNWYDWYYGVVTGRSIQAKIDIDYFITTKDNINLNKDTRIKYQDIEWDNTDDSYTDTLEDLIGEHNEDDVTRVSTIDYWFDWYLPAHKYKSILKYKDKYILKKESVDPDFAKAGNFFDEEYCYITIKSPINL
jgi:hypothetical protein